MKLEEEIETKHRKRSSKKHFGVQFRYIGEPKQKFYADFYKDHVAKFSTERGAKTALERFEDGKDWWRSKDKGWVAILVEI